MEKKKFKKLNEDERRAKLFLAIVLKSKGKIAEDTILDTVNKLDISQQFRLKEYTNSKEFFRNTGVDDFNIDEGYIHVDYEELIISIFVPDIASFQVSKRIEYVLENFNIKKSN
jgi:hypothetical protein